MTVMVALQAQGWTREKLFRSEDRLPVLPLTELTLMRRQGPLLSTQSPSWGPFQCVFASPSLPLGVPWVDLSPAPPTIFQAAPASLTYTHRQARVGAGSGATATNRKP